MMHYTVRFTRDTHGWTCSVYALSASGAKEGTAIHSGTGRTQQAAKDHALSLPVDIDVRAALSSADPTRPHWVQGMAGEKLQTWRGAETRRNTPLRKRRHHQPSLATPRVAAAVAADEITVDDGGSEPPD